MSLLHIANGAVYDPANDLHGVVQDIWIHNGKDERINARHAKNTRSNLLFFDNSAASFDTFNLSSVRATNATDVRWRF